MVNLVFGTTIEPTYGEAIKAEISVATYTDSRPAIEAAMRGLTIAYNEVLNAMQRSLDGRNE